MKKIVLALLCTFFCLSNHAQEACYSVWVGQADTYYDSKNYQAAWDYYSAAKDCVDKPSDMSYIEGRLKKLKAILNPPVFEVSSDRVSVSNAGSNGKIAIRVKNINSWRIVSTDIPNWLNVSKKGSSVEYKVEKNPTIETRTYILRLKADKLEQSIIFVQNAEDVFLRVSMGTVRIDNRGGTHSISISTNDPNGYSISNVDSWLKITKTESGIDLSCEANAQYEIRATNITASTTSKSETIRVIQEAKPIRFRFDAASVRVVSDFEMSARFMLKNGDHIQIDAGIWDIWRSGNLSGGFSASYIWTHEFTDEWILDYGVGLGFGGVRRYESFGDKSSRFVVAAVPSIGLEWAPYNWNAGNYHFGLFVDYRPFLGTDCKGFYHNATNFNIGARLHLL